MGKKQTMRLVRIVLVLILAAAAVGCFYYLLTLHIDSVQIVGNELFSDDEIANMVFPEERDTLVLEILGRREKRELPFIQKYEVEMVGMKGAKVTVYEKEVVGCFLYMETYMYFDKDGMILESSSKHLEGVPLIAGFSFDKVVMTEKLPVSDTKIFAEILNLAQQINTRDLKVSQIYFDSELNSTLYMEEPEGIRVYLGSADYVPNKLSLLADIQDQLDGLKGTLYLNDMTQSDNGKGTYTFKKD